MPAFTITFEYGSRSELRDLDDLMTDFRDYDVDLESLKVGESITITRVS